MLPSSCVCVQKTCCSTEHDNVDSDLYIYMKPHCEINMVHNIYLKIHVISCTQTIF